MKRIRTTEVGSHTGERVRVAGWLHSWRQLGGVSFLVIRDGWGTIQAVAETEAAAGVQEIEFALRNIKASDALLLGMYQQFGDQIGENAAMVAELCRDREG